MDTFDLTLRTAVYRHFASAGQSPTLDAMPEAIGATNEQVSDGYRRLYAKRMLVPAGDFASMPVIAASDATAFHPLEEGNATTTMVERAFLGLTALAEAEPTRFHHFWAVPFSDLPIHSDAVTLPSWSLSILSNSCSWNLRNSSRVT